MPFRIVRRAWPEGGIDEAIRPREHRIVSSHDTWREAEQAAETLAAGFAYHRFDRIQGHWNVQNEGGLTFTFAVEPT
jgi:hypothetical protein